MQPSAGMKRTRSGILAAATSPPPLIGNSISPELTGGKDEQPQPQPKRRSAKSTEAASNSGASTTGISNNMGPLSLGMGPSGSPDLLSTGEGPLTGKSSASLQQEGVIGLGFQFPDDAGVDDVDEAGGERNSKRARHTSPYREGAASAVLRMQEARPTRVAMAPTSSMRKSINTAPKASSSSSAVRPVASPSVEMEAMLPQSQLARTPMPAHGLGLAGSGLRSSPETAFTGSDSVNSGGPLNKAMAVDGDDGEDDELFPHDSDYQGGLGGGRTLPLLPAINSRGSSPAVMMTGEEGREEWCSIGNEEDAAMLQPAASSRTAGDASGDDNEVEAMAGPTVVDKEARQQRREQRQRERETRALALAAHQYSALMKQLRLRMEVERRYLNLGSGLVNVVEGQYLPFTPPTGTAAAAAAGAGASAHAQVPFALLPQGLWLAAEAAAACNAASASSALAVGPADAMPPWASKAIRAYMDTVRSSGEASYGGAETFRLAFKNYLSNRNASAASARSPGADWLACVAALHRSLGDLGGLLPSSAATGGGTIDSQQQHTGITTPGGAIRYHRSAASSSSAAHAVMDAESSEGKSHGLKAKGLARNLLAYLRQQRGDGSSAGSGKSAVGAPFDDLGRGFFSAASLANHRTSVSSVAAAVAPRKGHDDEEVESELFYHVPPFRTSGHTSARSSSSSSSSASGQQQQPQPMLPWVRLAELVVVCPEEIFGMDYDDDTDSSDYENEVDDHDNQDEGYGDAHNSSGMTATNTSSAGNRSLMLVDAANANVNDTSFGSATTSATKSSHSAQNAAGRSKHGSPAAAVAPVSPSPVKPGSSGRVKRPQVIISPEVMRKPAATASGSAAASAARSAQKAQSKRHSKRRTRKHLSLGDDDASTGTSDSDGDGFDSCTSTEDEIDEIVSMGGRARLLPAGGNSGLKAHTTIRHHQQAYFGSEGLDGDGSDSEAMAGGAGAGAMPVPMGAVHRPRSSYSGAASTQVQVRRPQPPTIDNAEHDDGKSRPDPRKARVVPRDLLSFRRDIGTFDSEEEAMAAVETANRCRTAGACLAMEACEDNAAGILVATTTCEHHKDHYKEVQERRKRAAAASHKRSSSAPSSSSSSLPLLPHSPDVTSGRRLNFDATPTHNPGAMASPAPAAAQRRPRRPKAIVRSYKLQEVLGSGSFGVVHRAVEVTLMPLVLPTAVKPVQPSSSAACTGSSAEHADHNSYSSSNSSSGKLFALPPASNHVTTPYDEGVAMTTASSIAARTRSRTVHVSASASASSSSTSAMSVVPYASTSAAGGGRARSKTTHGAGTTADPHHEQQHQQFAITPADARTTSLAASASSRGAAYALGSARADATSSTAAATLTAKALRSGYAPSAFGITSHVRLPIMRLVAVKLENLTAGDEDSYDSQLQNEYESYYRVWRHIDRLRRREVKVRRKVGRREQRLHRAGTSAEADLLSSKLHRAQRKLDQLSAQVKESLGFPKAHAYGLLRKEQLGDGTIRRYRGLVLDHVGSSLEQLHEELENFKTPHLERSLMVRDHALLYPTGAAARAVADDGSAEYGASDGSDASVVRHKLMEGMLPAPYSSFVAPNPTVNVNGANEKASLAERAAVLKSKAYKLYQRQELLALKRYLLQRAAAAEAEAEAARKQHQHGAGEQLIHLPGASYVEGYGTSTGVEERTISAATAAANSFFVPSTSSSSATSQASTAAHGSGASTVNAAKRTSSFSLRGLGASALSAVAAAATSVMRGGIAKNPSSAGIVSASYGSSTRRKSAASAASLSSSSSSSSMLKPLTLFPNHQASSVSLRGSSSIAAPLGSASTATNRRGSHATMAALLSAVPLTAVASAASSASSTPIHGPFISPSGSSSSLSLVPSQPYLTKESVDKLIRRLSAPASSTGSSSSSSMALPSLVEPEMSHGHPVMPIRMVLRYGIEMLKRLRFLHTVTGHCHRDQKPDNYTVGMPAMERSGALPDPPGTDKKLRVQRTNTTTSDSGSASSRSSSKKLPQAAGIDEDDHDEEDDDDGHDEQAEDEERLVYLIDYGLMREHSLGKPPSSQPSSASQPASSSGGSSSAITPASARAAYRIYREQLRSKVLGLGNNHGPSVGLASTTLLEENLLGDGAGLAADRSPIYYPFEEIRSEQKRRNCVDTARHISGTPRYASLWVHLGLTEDQLYTPKEDIEALVFVLLYLAAGRLPWQGLVLNKASDIRDKWIGHWKLIYTCTEEGLKQLTSRNRFNPVPHLQSYLNVIYNVTKDAACSISGHKQHSSSGQGVNSHRSGGSGSSNDGPKGYFLQPSDCLEVRAVAEGSHGGKASSGSSTSGVSSTAGVDIRVLYTALQGGLRPRNTVAAANAAFGAAPVTTLDDSDALYFLACMLEQPWALEAVPVPVNGEFPTYTALQRAMREQRQKAAAASSSRGRASALLGHGKPAAAPSSSSADISGNGNPSLNPAFKRVTYSDVLALVGVGTASIPPSTHLGSTDALAAPAAVAMSSVSSVETVDAAPDVWDTVTTTPAAHHHHHQQLQAQHHHASYQQVAPSIPLLNTLPSPPQPEPTPLPPCFAQWIRHIRALKKGEWPDYELLLGYLERDLKELEEGAYERLVMTAAARNAQA